MYSLQKLRQEDFDKVYEIMEEAFPFDERRTYCEQKALLLNPDYGIYVLAEAVNGEIKAFITVYRFDGFAFIEHFATSRAYRNQGLGSLVLCELSRLLQCKMCLEVETPQTEFARRRIEFYKRNGFYVNDYEYVQPPISEGKKAIPMILMTSSEGASESEFSVLKETIYKRVYGVI